MLVEYKKKYKKGRNIMKKAAIARILVIGAACLVIGCGKKEDEKNEAEEPKTETNEVQEVKIEDEEYKTIGQESADAYQLLLTNHTGGEITGFAIKVSTAQEASQNLLQAGMKIEQEETVRVYYAPEAGSTAQTTYDLNLSYADGHAVEIAGLGLDGMKEADLCFEDEVGFVKYKKEGSGEEISTKDMALALKAQKEAQKAAEAQSQKEQAEQAAAQAQADAAAQQVQYDEPVYNEPVYDQPVYDQPVYDQTAVPGGQDVSQTGEGCLTEGGGAVMNPNYDPNAN